MTTPQETYTQTPEIRLDRSGQVDDVAITGDLFRMERMNDQCWWVAIYRGENRTTFNLQLKEGRLEATLIEDSIGCQEVKP
jgi:hypothetical protein